MHFNNKKSKTDGFTDHLFLFKKSDFEEDNKILAKEILESLQNKFNEHNFNGVFRLENECYLNNFIVEYKITIPDNKSDFNHLWNKILRGYSFNGIDENSFKTYNISKDGILYIEIISQTRKFPLGIAQGHVKDIVDKLCCKYCHEKFEPQLENIIFFMFSHQNDGNEIISELCNIFTDYFLYKDSYKFSESFISYINSLRITKIKNDFRNSKYGISLKDYGELYYKTEYSLYSNNIKNVIDILKCDNGNLEELKTKFREEIFDIGKPIDYLIKELEEIDYFYHDLFDEKYKEIFGFDDVETNNRNYFPGHFHNMHEFEIDYLTEDNKDEI